MTSLIEKLSSRSCGFSLHYLIHLFAPYTDINFYFVNGNSNVEYRNSTYIASSFNYIPEKSEYGLTGGGSLEITTDDNNIINLVEACSNVQLQVEAVMDESGTITPIESYNHSYGHISGDRTKITFDYDSDDRLDMTFPTLIWANNNNRGNA